MINEIFLDKRLESYNKIVIGDNNIFSDKIKNLTVLNQQKNDIVLNYMNNSKLLLMTSLFDSSPNTLFEAVQCGCNVIISKNIGIKICISFLLLPGQNEIIFFFWNRKN